ncbi:MAG: bifunctional hydroxymethylpyrimidine kinase/phosphomethylpyrimidine kinase [Betaproteobacteria bacterium TMED41]|nr:MAG: bifunctional hydroxymethylpyrimidine kinase/phosphomethylpyrimidine kinase [Betaproteobacteria bacterium TMED41]
MYKRGKILVRPAIILTIAGSDSGAGAGIQADVKSISANGGYAVTVITAITAQNTKGVQNIFPISSKLVKDQLCSIFADFKVDAVKIGMLHNAEIVKTVADTLEKYKPKFVVFDPVMVSSSGDILTEKDSISTMIERLFPLCSLVTPNFDETVSIILASRMNKSNEIQENVKLKNSNFLQTIKDNACKISKLGAASILITGVCIENFNDEEKTISTDNFFDVLFSNNQFSFFGKPKILSKNTHGTGCSLSSSIATNLAFGENIVNAVNISQKYVHECILSAKNLEIGQGNGPINHFFLANSVKILS